ncbi:MAG TPA: permease [Deltaproteobacteria bacterium]|nr:permease [Deltaproteobacteria bacterium]
MWRKYFLGAGLGALTPFCSYSTVPITAGLLKGGVPFGPVMSFLLSSPVLNPVIVALMLSLLGYKVTILYVVVTFLGSMIAAAMLARFGMESQVKPLLDVQQACCTGGAKQERPDLSAISETTGSCCSSANIQPFPIITLPNNQASGCCCTSEPAAAAGAETVQTSCCSVGFEKRKTEGGSFKEKMKRASLSAIDTFKGVFWYLLLGAGIGAFIYGFFPQDLVVRLAGPGNPLSIPIAALVGVPMYIRSETVIPIGAALVEKGMGVGTVLALVIGGAGASIPEMIILGSMFKKKLVFAFVLNVFLVAIAAGYLVDLLIY